MTNRYVQVRPVTRQDDGNLTRAFDDDPVEAWGVYVTNLEGLPMHELDFPTRATAIADARQQAVLRGLPLRIDELDGTTTID